MGTHKGGIMPSKTITISTEKWERVKAAFARSIPLNPETGEPEYTDTEWPFVALKRYVARIVKGYENERQGLDNAPAFDENIMDVT